MIKFIKILIAAIIVVPFFILSYIPLFIAFCLKKAGNNKKEEVDSPKRGYKLHVKRL